MADELFPDIEDLLDDDFPFGGNIPTADDLEEGESTEEEVEEPIPYGTTWKFNFDIGDMYTDSNGQFSIVSEHDTLHEWIAHVLNTEKYETPIFLTETGTLINLLIGEAITVDGQLMVEVAEEIASAIIKHDRIIDLKVISVIPITYDMYVIFSYETDDSEPIIEVARL